MLAMLSTMLVVGGHYGVHSIASIYYPTAIRASGGGWATSIAKFGGIAGPALGGMLLQSGVAAARMFAFLTVCPAILAACALGIALIVRRGAPVPLPLPAAVAGGS